MKITTIEPDIVLYSKLYHDKLKITIEEKEVLFEAIVDGAGCQWTINRKQLKELL